MPATLDPWVLTVGTEAEAEMRDPVAPEPPAAARKRLPSGSPQQEAFWEELLTGHGNILLEARAGTGKSTSCREGMWRLLEHEPSRTLRYCCFNKKISEEFKASAPEGVSVSTMHSCGFGALRDAFQSQLNPDKTYVVIDTLPNGTKLPRYIRKAIKKTVELAKNHGLRPGGPDLYDSLESLIDRHDIETWRRTGEVIGWSMDVLERSAEMTALADYDDMLWLTVLHEVRLPGTDDLFIDECQDLNPIQHEMAERLCMTGRTIVVGDPFQSIYAFRGADSDSIAKLKAKLGATTLPLTVTFRCPKSHVGLARELVPDFEAADSAPEGTLVHGPKDLIDDVVPGDLVLCRANAPVISACLRQIARLVPASVRGRAIGDQLVAVVKRLGNTPTIADFTRQLEKWRSAEIRRLEPKEGSEDLIEALTDRYLCLDAIAGACDSPAEIPSVIDRLFSDDDASNRVTFSSVHRAKGSEAKRVTYIQIPYSEKRDKVRPPQQWELDQRRNLRYVALTRSMDTLTLVS